MYDPVSGLKRWLTAPQMASTGGSRGIVVMASVVGTTSLGLLDVRSSQVTLSAVVHQLLTTSHQNPSAHDLWIGLPRKHTKNLQIELDFESLYRSRLKSDTKAEISTGTHLWQSNWSGRKIGLSTSSSGGQMKFSPHFASAGNMHLSSVALKSNPGAHDLSAQ